MDINDILTTGGVSTGMITLILIIIKVIKSLNNKKYRSSCCGKNAEVVIAVNELTEEEKKTPVLKPVEAKIEIPPLNKDGTGL